MGQSVGSRSVRVDAKAQSFTEVGKVKKMTSRKKDLNQIQTNNMKRTGKSAMRERARSEKRGLKKSRRSRCRDF
jgi:hypothetical protein